MLKRKKLLKFLISFIFITYFVFPAEAIDPSKENKGSISNDYVKERIRNTRDYVFEQDGLYGITNKNGKVLVDAIYIFISNKMEDNRLQVVKEGKAGFLDEEYNLVIDTIYDSATSFSEGLARLEIGDESFYINVFGKVISPKGEYVHIGQSKGEKTIVYVDGKYGVLNKKTGEIIVKIIYDKLFFLPSGRYLVAKAEDQGKSSFSYYEIDHEGNEKQVSINNPVVNVDESGYITFYQEFTADYSPTEYDSGKDGVINKMGLLNKDYQEILKPIHEDIWPVGISFADEMAIIKTNSDNWKGSLARGIVGNGQYGVINRAGHYLLPPVYHSLRYLGYGKFLAEQDGATNVIDIQGNKLAYSYGENYTSSEWAKDDLAEVGYLGLISDEIDNKYRYQWNITRQEFCELAMNLFVRVKGKEALPKIKDIAVFYDTNSKSVLMAYDLGIVKGSAGGFAPFNDITRQEAAVMLVRLASFLGLSGDETYIKFNDDEDIAPWAKESVYIMTTIKDAQTSKSIMGGTGGNTFTPLDPFTTEQAIITMLRLYNVVVPVEN